MFYKRKKKNDVTFYFVWNLPTGGGGGKGGEEIHWKNDSERNVWEGKIIFWGCLFGTFPKWAGKNS